MKDTIYREDAIDAMMKLQAEDDEAYGCHIVEGFDGERAKEALEQLPSAQPDVPDTNVGDMISRQAAIDAVYLQSDDDGWWCGTAEDMEKLLKGLPSAEPNATGIINRQAAIDRINEQRKHLQPDVYPQDKIGDAAYRICSELIERLPSAQPEIVRCKDCKHSFLHDNGERISRICGLTRMCGTTPDDWFCADAERGEE